MGEIISTFHLDLKLIIAQLVNFGVVVFVLWYFALKPLAKKMSERTETIEKSLADAKKIQDNLKDSDAEKSKIIKEARVESVKIIAESKKIADQEGKNSVEKAKMEVKKIVEESRQQITAEKQKMISEVRNEMADLIVLATTKVLGKMVDKKVDADLVQAALKEIKK
ncbi:MAG: F0F1 ATP synthase subunit B [Candidatus Buchananbacteria bacterium]